MIFPEVTIEDWSKKYPGLIPRTTSCKHCGDELTTTIPYISKDYAGFIVFECPSCGGEHKASNSRPISESEIRSWNDAFSAIN